ncbi:MAG: hypothetical protein KJN84_09760 [Bacteroidia bacterium]|nr:hypothetical protein [Bacteroidia bacterium]
MKKLIIIAVILILISCGNSNEKKTIPTFQENELSFLHLRFGYDKSNKWIKKPGNILMLHETFKKVGYENMINKEGWESNWNWWLDIKRSPKNLIDSLEITYSNYNESPKYYREFWQRRIEEKNDETVYRVVKEIKQIMIANEVIELNQESVNDTLFQLMSFEFPERDLTENEMDSLLNFLIEIGLHESAYNLVSGENGQIWNQRWNKKKDEILPLLVKSETYHRPWLDDNTK